MTEAMEETRTEDMSKTPPVSEQRQELEKSRGTAFRLIQLNLTIISLFALGITFGAKNQPGIKVTTFLNEWLVAGGFALVSSTVIATLVVVKTTFDKAEISSFQQKAGSDTERETFASSAYLTNRTKIMIGAMVVLATWTLPLFFVGVSEPLFDKRLTVFRIPFFAVALLLHTIPTVHFVYRTLSFVQ